MLEKFKKQLVDNEEVYLRIKVRAGAGQNKVKDILDDDSIETIKIDIKAEPVKGRANQELIKFLAKEFGVLKNNVKIISGAGEKIKLVKIIN